MFEKKSQVRLYWRSYRSSDPGFFCVESSDGKNFQKTSSAVTLFDSKGKKQALIEIPQLRASMVGAQAVATFLDQNKNLVIATVGRGISWKVCAETTLFRGATVMVKLPARNGKKARIIAFSPRSSRTLFQAHATEDFKRWRDDGDVLSARRNRFDGSALLPLYAELLPQGILLVYTAKDQAGKLTVGAALFDRDAPDTLLWRSDEALFLWSGRVPENLSILGGANIGKYFFLYVQSRGKVVERFPMARYWETVHKHSSEKFVLPARKKGTPIVLHRAETNPVLEPIIDHAWEAFATFNPAALLLDERVHLLYRAQGYDGLSVLGYAMSSDGIQIDERLASPVFVPSKAGSDARARRKNVYVSGGGTSGCEDPRLVEIDGTVYLIYVTFDGCHPPGVALSYITKKDFLKRRWNWSSPKLISRPGAIQKNWVLFPKKIRGKYVVLHGLSPRIRIEYVSNLKRLGEDAFIESLSSHGGGGYVEATRLHAWDNIVRGVGAPPLQTKYGWLVFYHGMDMRDPGKYKAGVMLLDLEHPEIIVKRSVEPVLEPETAYENGGHKRGVVYICGAVIKGGKLFVYYGAADRTSAVAVADAETFLQSLLREEPPVLQKMNLKKTR